MSTASDSGGPAASDFQLIAQPPQPGDASAGSGAGPTAPAASSSRAPSFVRNVLSNWTVTAAGVIYSLLITPVVIRALDAEKYGIWSFLNGLLSYTDLLYLGLGSALIRYVAQYRARGDQAAVNRLASVVLTIFIVLGSTAFLAATLFSVVVPDLFATELSPDVGRSASVTFVLLGAQVALYFVGSAAAGVIYGHDRYDLVNLSRLIVIAVRAVAIPLAVQGPNPLVRLAILSSVSTALEVLLLGVIVRQVNPSLRVNLTKPRRPELATLYGFGLHSFLIVFAVKLISYADTTVIAMTLGAASVSLYVLPLQLIEYARTAIAGFTTVFLPRLSTAHAMGDLAALRRAYLQSTRIAAVVAAFMLTNISFLTPPFLALWVGAQFAQGIQYVAIWLSAATFLQVFNSIASLPFYQAMHILKVPARVMLIEAALNLGLSIVLARWLNITGVALATFLPAFFVSALILPRYLWRQLSLSLKEVFVQSILPAFLVTVAVALSHFVTANLIEASSYAALATRVAITIPLCIVVLLPCLSADERQALLRRDARNELTRL